MKCSLCSDENEWMQTNWYKWMKADKHFLTEANTSKSSVVTYAKSLANFDTETWWTSLKIYDIALLSFYM